VTLEDIDRLEMRADTFAALAVTFVLGVALGFDVLGWSTVWALSVGVALGLVAAVLYARAYRQRRRLRERDDG
jgi:Flp pilus assembly protein TadB